MDVSATHEFSKNFTTSGKVSLIRGSDEKNDDYLVFIPSNRYELQLGYKEPDGFALKDFYFEATLKFVDKQRRAPRVITPREFQESQEDDSDPFNGDYSNFDFMEAPPAYALVNVSTGFSVKKENVRYNFRVAAENLLNTSYREYTNRFRYYADDLGRNFILSFKCIFWHF